jgi:hypothetical protein
MNISEHLNEVFPKAQFWGRDADIEARPNLMELPEPGDLLAVVPAYMLWCARHPESPELVSDFTLAALAEYGRCKNPENPHLNFLYRCTENQLDAVVSFLEWASEAIPFHHREMVERALRNWKNAGGKSLQPGHDR